MPLIQEIDYGTPESPATEQVTLTIDGQEVTVPAGTSIMRASMEAGIKHPEALRHRHAGQLRQLPRVPGARSRAAPARRRPAPRRSHRA